MLLDAHEVPAKEVSDELSTMGEPKARGAPLALGEIEHLVLEYGSAEVVA